MYLRTYMEEPLKYKDKNLIPQKKRDIGEEFPSFLPYFLHVVPPVH